MEEEQSIDYVLLRLERIRDYKNHGSIRDEYSRFDGNLLGSLIESEFDVLNRSRERMKELEEFLSSPVKLTKEEYYSI